MDLQVDDDDLSLVSKLKKIVTTYLWIKSGTTAFPSETRHIATGVQFVMIYLCTTFSMCYQWLLDYQTRNYSRYGHNQPSQSSISKFFWLIFVGFSFLFLIYFSIAFFFSMVSNIPRVLKAKNSVQTFFYTLIFAESFVLTILLWVVYFLLTYLETSICPEYSLCGGFLSGIFVFCNLVLFLSIVSIVQLKRSLGIGFKDVYFGRT